MSIEKPKDERRELYDKFRAGLKGGDETSSFYDEDDLIDIYDQAADLEDEYVKIEVLLAAAGCIPTARFWRHVRDICFLHTICRTE